MIVPEERIKKNAKERFWLNWINSYFDIFLVGLEKIMTIPSQDSLTATFNDYYIEKFHIIIFIVRFVATILINSELFKYYVNNKAPDANQTASTNHNMKTNKTSVSVARIDLFRTKHSNFSKFCVGLYESWGHRIA
jgi:hypothetical protein